MAEQYEDFRTGEPLLLPCHCCGCQHNLIAEWSIEIMENIGSDLDMSAMNFYYKPISLTLFQRIKSAILILFRLQDDYQQIDIDIEYAKELKAYLDEFLIEHSESNEVLNGYKKYARP